MATLPPYFGPGTRGEPVQLKAHLVVWPTVGSGRFTAFGEYAASFECTYRILGFSGSVSLSITLTDRDPAATSGPATVVCNGRTDANARYSAADAALTVTTSAIGDPGRFTVWSEDGATYIDPGGMPVNPRLRITPE